MADVSPGGRTQDGADQSPPAPAGPEVQRGPDQAAHVAQRRLDQLLRITAHLGGATDLGQVAEAVVTEATGAVAASAAVLCTLRRGAFELLAASGLSAQVAEEYRSFPLAAPLPGGDAVRARRPVLLRSQADRDARYPALAGVPMSRQSWATLPLVVEGRAVGMLACGWDNPGGFDDATVAWLQAVADQCAVALDRARLYEAERDARRRLQVLAEAGRLLGSTLDSRATLRGLARLVLPVLGDACAVHVVDARGLALVEVAHVDPDQERLLRDLAARTEGYSRSARLLEVVRTGKPLLFPEIPPELLAEQAENAEHAKALTALRVRSGLAVPLTTGNRTLGTLSLVISNQDRRYEEDDVSLAADLGARAAVALANAQAHQQLAENARTLQHSLLPVLQDCDELEAAARYVPGAEGTAVGGDFYDVIDLGGGRISLLAGDVMGRGLRAAAVMGQLRAALRGYLLLGLGPAEALHSADELLEELPSDRLATCLVAVYDAPTRWLTVASAGHPPALLATPGRTQRLEVEPRVVLGVGDSLFGEARYLVPTGAIVALYTDGLVEDRTRDIDTGIDLLGKQLADAEPGADLGQLADRILAALGRSQSHDDDVALLLARPCGQVGDVGWTLRLDLDWSPHASGHARQAVGHILRDWALPSAVTDTIILMADELVTNAFQHGRPPGQLRLRRSSHRIHLEVEDGGGSQPRARYAAPMDETGRGLSVVAALSSRWGNRSTPGGKIVWAEIDQMRMR